MSPFRAATPGIDARAGRAARTPRDRVVLAEGIADGIAEGIADRGNFRAPSWGWTTRPRPCGGGQGSSSDRRHHGSSSGAHSASRAAPARTSRARRPPVGRRQRAHPTLVATFHGRRAPTRRGARAPRSGRRRRRPASLGCRSGDDRGQSGSCRPFGGPAVDRPAWPDPRALVGHGLGHRPDGQHRRGPRLCLLGDSRRHELDRTGAGHPSRGHRPRFRALCRRPDGLRRNLAGHHPPADRPAGRRRHPGVSGPRLQPGDARSRGTRRLRGTPPALAGRAARLDDAAGPLPGGRAAHDGSARRPRRTHTAGELRRCRVARPEP